MRTEQLTAKSDDIEGQQSLWPPESTTKMGSDPTVSVTVPEPCIVGIDTSRVPVRLVVATPGDGEGMARFASCPRDMTSFDSLRDFAGYWHAHFKHYRYGDVRIAVPKNDPDPLGVQAWLVGQCQPLERYEWMAYRRHLTKDLELRDLDLPEAFQRAYVLTLYSSYRLRAASVARDLWAKIFEAHYLLLDIKHEAHRLAASLPELEDWPGLDVPF